MPEPYRRHVEEQLNRLRAELVADKLRADNGIPRFAAGRYSKMLQGPPRPDAETTTAPKNSAAEPSPNPTDRSSGILYIDEAYELLPNDGAAAQTGQPFTDELLELMNRHPGQVVAAARYTDTTLPTEPTEPTRRSVEELMTLATARIAARGSTLEPAAEETLRTALEQISAGGSVVPDARLIYTLIEYAGQERDFRVITRARAAGGRPEDIPTALLVCITQSDISAALQTVLPTA